MTKSVSAYLSNGISWLWKRIQKTLGLNHAKAGVNPEHELDEVNKPTEVRLYLISQITT